MKDSLPTVAALQINSSNSVEANLQKCEALIESLSSENIDVLLLPETFAFMGKSMHEQIEHAEEQGHGKIQEWLSQIAVSLACTVIGGTIPIKNKKDKVTASCLVFSEKGECVSRYDKMHLFDVSLPEKKQVYEESAVYHPGESGVVVKTSAGLVGLSVCYDLRFPELFREYAQQGADILCVPAAFTDETGKAHWQTLLRARAIENQCYVIAAAQVGLHHNGRKTHGHSMIIDPWGDTIDVLPHQEGLVKAVIDKQKQLSLRETFPVLKHRKSISVRSQANN